MSHKNNHTFTLTIYTCVCFTDGRAFFEELAMVSIDISQPNKVLPKRNAMQKIHAKR